MRSKLIFFSAMFALTGCSGSSVPAAAPPGVPLAQSGELTFPAAGGFAATAYYTLSSAPNGARAVLRSQAGSAGLPHAYGLALGPFLAGFTFTVTQPVVLAHLPTLQLTAPARTLADGVSTELCPGSFCAYSAGPDTINGETISYDFSLGSGGPSPTLSLSPGTVYAFEVMGPYNAPAGSLPP